MGNPVVHFEIRSADPDAVRELLRQAFRLGLPGGGIPGYTYVESGVPDAMPGGIGPTQGGTDLVTVFVGVDDVEATLKAGRDARRHDRAAGDEVPGVTFGLFADTGGHVRRVWRRRTGPRRKRERARQARRAGIGVARRRAAPPPRPPCDEEVRCSTCC